MSQDDLSIRPIRCRRWMGAWPLLLVSAAFVHNLATSWLKWGDPVVDGGREMMMPARMLLGEVIYRDHRHVYGPLAPYVNMALYRVFGIHLSVLQGAGIVAAALMAAAVYGLARRFLERAASASLAVLFLYANAFAHLTPNPSFNFVVPYAYAATYGMLAATSSLVMLVCHAQRGRDVHLVWSIAGLVLTALSKLEPLVPIAAAHATFLAGMVLQGRITRRLLAPYALGALAIAVPYGVLFAWIGPALWTDNLAALANTGIRSFAAETMGLQDVWGSMGAMGISSLLLAFALGIAVVASRLLRRERPAALRLAALTVPPAIAFLAYASAGPDLPFRVLSVAVVGALGVLAWRFATSSERRADLLPSLILWVFAAGSLVRLGLHARASHYGFYLLPVPMVAFGVLVFRDLPDALGATGRCRAVLVGTGLAVVAGIAVATFTVSAARYAEHDMVVETHRGHMILRGERWQPAIVSLLRGLPPGSRVAVIPQGAGLLFLAGVRMVDGVYFHAPMEYSGRYTDEQVARRFLAEPPDYVVYLQQQPGSFRYTGFGIEFGHITASWLRSQYVPVAGNSAIVLLRHAGLQPTGLRPGLQVQ